ncbi:uncharacterized protein YukE [Arthrobacter stackebrandtii]|uniref:Uncharacterized protein YukE n=1 Tax=Arthrobacter stackebrandtii TaxID=272161 RepID=A0ABS4YX83_9MICC|nr:WXG100 family type VII secretion target [Arthrobacter stackebrandtii]MBP2413409.1 uncharacterized protein YukE [Arthrobacter stackebrandtii]PYH00738.1 hypothetical protein CVV67_09515 [Arthrobacter stackebrandtii]
MADGMIGADPEQLRDLAKTMATSGETLTQLSSTLHNVISRAQWNGPDSEMFRGRWNNGLRLTLHDTGATLTQQSAAIKAQADEQEQASADTGGGTGGGAPGGGSSGGDGADSPLQGLVDANGNPIYQAGNLFASATGILASNLLGKMVDAGLLRRMPWSLLSAEAGQLGQYVKGTQLLNGLSMVGRAAGVLSVIGGGVQLANGIMTGDTNQIIDGGVTTVLAVGSFIPVVGPAFAVAGVAWAGLGMLSTSLGYGSTSEMIGAGASWVGDKVSDGAEWLGKETANVAKKAWGWLTGG